MAKPTEQEINNLCRYFAIETNNEFWRLSEKELSSDEKRDILSSAFTSLYHWKQVGNDENKYLAYLALARALTINEISELAVDYATQAYNFFLNTDQQWVSAFTHAISSHAFLISGATDKAVSHYNEARKIGESLEPDDKQIFVATFNLIPNPEILTGT
ncbi:MAG: hypothetical protein GY744_16865 [Gammaproteobacteria bacterium]|nr:hypothetical protein [Gammaproteobacteria bacterium]